VHRSELFELWLKPSKITYYISQQIYSVRLGNELIKQYWDSLIRASSGNKRKELVKNTLPKYWKVENNSSYWMNSRRPHPHRTPQLWIKSSNRKNHILVSIPVPLILGCGSPACETSTFRYLWQLTPPRILAQHTTPHITQTCIVFPFHITMTEF
jgi:hypothetical protein